MKERPNMLMRRAKASLVPVSGYDDELLSEIPEGELVEVTTKRRRSLPQLRLYWGMLHRVVKATDAYPTAERLHEALKIALGFTTPIRLLDGSEAVIPDSCAFDKMDAGEFRIYMDRAVELLNRLTGTDVLAEAA